MLDLGGGLRSTSAFWSGHIVTVLSSVITLHNLKPKEKKTLFVLAIFMCNNLDFTFLLKYDMTYCQIINIISNKKV